MDRGSCSDLPGPGISATIIDPVILMGFLDFVVAVYVIGGLLYLVN